MLWKLRFCRTLQASQYGHRWSSKTLIPAQRFLSPVPSLCSLTGYMKQRTVAVEPLFTAQTIGHGSRGFEEVRAACEKRAMADTCILRHTNRGVGGVLSLWHTPTDRRWFSKRRFIFRGWYGRANGGARPRPVQEPRRWRAERSPTEITAKWIAPQSRKAEGAERGNKESELTGESGQNFAQSIAADRDRHSSIFGKRSRII